MLSLQFESQGTRNFFTLYPAIWNVLSLGGIAVLDELDNDIHPMMLVEIIQKFQSESTNPFNAQLIMSCHDATLLQHLVKEEVYLTEKKFSGRTVVYGAKNIQRVRRDTNLYAKYLSGALGAIPRMA